MDAHKFDSLTRHVTRNGTRRLLLRGLVPALLAPVLPVSLRPAAAGCKEVGKQCDKGRDCCDHAKCKSKKCRCKDGFKNCDGKCFNLDSDEKHCGTCKTRCSSAERCCDGVCFNLDNDPSNCGACGLECEPGRTCCKGKCVDLNRNDDHCGKCDFACPSDQECLGGSCESPPSGCPPGGDSCSATGTIPCGDGLSTCACLQTTEGFTFCGEALPSGAECGECETSADCPQGPLPTFCARNECCPDSPSGRNACVTICAT